MYSKKGFNRLYAQTNPLHSHCLTHTGIFFFYLVLLSIERSFHHPTSFYFPFTRTLILPWPYSLRLLHQFIQEHGGRVMNGGGGVVYGGLGETHSRHRSISRTGWGRDQDLHSQSHTLLLTGGCQNDGACDFSITIPIVVKRIELGVIPSTKQRGMTKKTSFVLL